LRNALTIGSLATLILLFVAAARENYFAEWRQTQRDYRTLLLAKAEGEGEVKAARGFGVEIRQIVARDLNTFDRCISCHLGLDDPRMADAPQPYTTHPGDYLQDHDMDKFGCTVCHQGQGRATNKLEAHARSEGVFWETPMLPPPLTQSSCGACHDPGSLAKRGAPMLTAGLRSLRTSGCLGCHKLGGRGGPLGPALDQIGDKTKHAYSYAHVEGDRQVWTWHREHLRSPQTVVPESKMPAGQEDEEEIDALVTYLLSLRSTNLTEQLTPRDRYEERYRIWHTQDLSGSEIYEQFCYACHEDGTDTIFHDTLEVTIPSIRHPDFLAVSTRDFLIESTRKGRAGTQMPAWGAESGGLTDAELGRLADYLLEDRLEVREIDFSMALEPDASNGEKIFHAECTDCHVLSRIGGEAPWLGSPEFQETYSDGLMGHTIKYGRTDTFMIGYGAEVDGDLTDEEISDLISFIRTLN
jgi:mono/diheme cytochrome c family protein